MEDDEKAHCIDNEEIKEATKNICLKQAENLMKSNWKQLIMDICQKYIYHKVKCLAICPKSPSQRQGIAELFGSPWNDAWVPELHNINFSLSMQYQLFYFPSYQYQYQDQVI